MIFRTLIIIASYLLLAAGVCGQDRACLFCHNPQPPADQQNAQSVDTSVLAASVHRDIGCSDCHQVSSGEPHRGNRIVYCASCHQDEAKGYNRSPHVAGRSVSVESLPTCVTCHGGHDLLPVDDPRSRTNHRNSVSICVKCHADESVTGKFTDVPDPGMIRAYEQSIHGKTLLIDGNMAAPACVDCHGSHSFFPSDEPESPIYKSHIAGTCGRCHGEISETYAESVHGTALAAGVLESPTCTNCHGEHNIRAHDDPASRVYATHVSTTCSDCHTSEALVAKFGLKADRIKTFKESYHGVVTEFGETRAANCASCHGAHDIFPQSDSRSLINAANIELTCGKCHEGLPADFAHSQVHTSASDVESGGEFYVRKFYIWFITIIIVAFVLFRVLEYRRRVTRVE
ncbi:MAG TPA: cytochrome c3 family protein [Acidobacteriota bacterium]|nr:cytochrome c3 family protein [Acidobacteriota bacterium]